MPGKTAPPRRITKFTNCRIVKGSQLVKEDLWIDSLSGKILKDQEAFYDFHLSPDEVIDLGGRIVAPGLIDVQLNGAQGFDFSVPQATTEEYERGLRMVNKGLARMGVTSYLPTVVSSTPEVYWKVLPSLGPTESDAQPQDGAESLGAHVEGPFISPGRNGIHKSEVLRAAQSLEDIVECYGSNNLTGSSQTVRMITAAPEVGNMLNQIPSLTSKNIIYSIGHSDATYEQALAATQSGATMITHLFNAMRPFYHRNPGVFGLFGQTDRPRPFYGVIADGIHLHPTSIRIAYNAHPTGLVLVTDAMRLCGLPDGVYDWTNGDRIVKTGARLTLEGSDKIAGSSATLIECVNNFRRWSGASTAEALNAATATPARLLGLEGVKGSLSKGADADLIVLDDEEDPFSGPTLTIRQVWKRGVKVFDTEDDSGVVPSKA
ncbi:N-acetyl-glucosamine-6-phosphate deacetylase [Aspergillus japonicus CBS 114.51]|uniref:N-acetylglucosamine-6-phosphate deacetylase n=1 Tax=Aspergillus japonicus CBS 114.51 TaxID=1448312 RepID=A0A8T8XCV4_ASPJA|nr:N-acetyl-glucosamine-6-phosphate deacetylase [Aspergillus japonicus CBS 114.51]RAH86097.1 N-acetyl-glucosamine-6-phosphate deacetylase [Aspergillus japonicus CBS 114.51]